MSSPNNNYSTINERVTHAVQAMTDSANRLQAYLNETNGTVNKLEERVASILHTLDEIKTDIKVLETATGDIKTRCAEHRGQLPTTTQIKEVETATTEIREHIVKLDHRLDNISTTVGDISTTLSRHGQRIQKIWIKVVALAAGSGGALATVAEIIKWLTKASGTH